MLTTTVQRTYTQNGREYPVPPEVLDLLYAADGVLRGRLADLAADGDLRAEWGIEPGAAGVWDIVVTIDGEGPPYSRRFPHTDLVIPRDRDWTIRDVVMGFTQSAIRSILGKMGRIRERIGELVHGLKE